MQLYFLFQLLLFNLASLSHLFSYSFCLLLSFALADIKFWPKKSKLLSWIGWYKMKPESLQINLYMYYNIWNREDEWKSTPKLETILRWNFTFIFRFLTNIVYIVFLSQENSHSFCLVVPRLIPGEVQELSLGFSFWCSAWWSELCIHLTNTGVNLQTLWVT